MRGIITTRHLVINAPTIIHEFGFFTYLRCVGAVLLSRRHVTFLECVCRLEDRNASRAARPSNHDNRPDNH